MKLAHLFSLASHSLYFCRRDALICSLVCAGTSLFAGFVIFAVIGFMAHELKVDIGDVMASGKSILLDLIIDTHANTYVPGRHDALNMKLSVYIQKDFKGTEHTYTCMSRTEKVVPRK